MELTAEQASQDAIAAATAHAEAVEKARVAQMYEALPGNLFEIMQKEISKSVRETVNGKIDAVTDKITIHNLKHEQDMKRILPVIQAYESAQQDLATAKKGGRAFLLVAGAISTVGGAYLVLRMIFFKF